MRKTTLANCRVAAMIETTTIYVLDRNDCWRVGTSSATRFARVKALDRHGWRVTESLSALYLALYIHLNNKAWRQATLADSTHKLKRRVAFCWFLQTNTQETRNSFLEFLSYKLSTETVHTKRKQTGRTDDEGRETTGRPAGVSIGE